jgi:hypothetical protein
LSDSSELTPHLKQAAAILAADGEMDSINGR